jgi:hypothetical protein
MLEVTNIRVKSFDVGYLDVYWDVAPCYESTQDYEFVVQVSEAEFGPYYDLTPGMVDVYHVRDNTVRGQHSYYHQRYYRVMVRKRSDPAVSKTYPDLGGVKLGAAPDLYALEMARINNLKLQEFMGRKIWIFPRKQSGQRCGVCYDGVMSRKVRSSCPSCFDTTWVGGFHQPIQVYGMIVTPNESTTQANFTRVQNENTTMLLGNYPEVSEGDVVVEAENVRWRIGSEIQKIHKARALIRQQVPVHRIPSSDIEYSLPINLSDADVRDLVASPARNYTNPHNLESVSLSEALNSVFGPK